LAKREVFGEILVAAAVWYNHRMEERHHRRAKALVTRGQSKAFPDGFVHGAAGV
jgi:hypothetical protein